MIRRMRALALVLIALSALAGCGKKGPLYLPDDNNSQAHHRAAPTEALARATS